MIAPELEVFGDSGEHWRIAAGSSAGGFMEARTYMLRTPADGCRLCVDDVELSQTTNDCRWTAGFFAGRVGVELVDPAGAVLGQYQLDVGPSPNKLGQPLFEAMVDDLLRFRPEWLLGFDANRDIFGADTSTAPLEIQYARLRSHAEACCRAFEKVCNRPITRLSQDRRLIPLHRVRRLDTRSASEIARTPLIAALRSGDSGAISACMIEAPIARVTLDNGANRTLACMLQRLLQRTTALIDWLECSAQRPASSLTPKCPRRLQILNRLRTRLQRIAHAAPFANVTRKAISGAGLTAISAHPVYAHAYSCARQALHAGIDKDRVADPLPITPTWQVYERWCFLCVAKALRQMYPDTIWKEHSWGDNVDQISITARIGDTELAAWLQPRFVAWDQKSTRGQKSLSRERVPDIIVTFGDAERSTFMVLDAKYRASRDNVLDAMQSAHIYRDSLFRFGQRAWGSFLLVPRASSAPWLSAPRFQREFGTGTLELADGENLDALRDLLEEFFATT